MRQRLATLWPLMRPAVTSWDTHCGLRLRRRAASVVVRWGVGVVFIVKLIYISQTVNNGCGGGDNRLAIVDIARYPYQDTRATA